jgi:hypothetical protein
MKSRSWDPQNLCRYDIAKEINFVKVKERRREPFKSESLAASSNRENYLTSLLHRCRAIKIGSPFQEDRPMVLI